MADAKEIKRKISSIKNTGKITKAMELISTVKMKKAQDLAVKKKGFVIEILKIFLRLGNFFKNFPYFQYGKGEKTLGIIIVSNKGLCGGYNINVLKKVSKYKSENDEEIDFMAIGKKASLFVVKTGHNLISDFSSDFGDNIDTLFTKNITSTIYNLFLDGKYKKVVVFYNYFENSIKQIPVAEQFLPIEGLKIKEYLINIAGEDFDEGKEQEKIKRDVEYYIEPSIKDIAMNVIPMILDMMFYDMILEAKASEHSSRMVAMKSAKDNANKIADDLTLKYNKARQSLITKEVSEIVAGVESLKE